MGGERRVFTCCDGHQDGSPRPQDKVIVQGHDERRASGKGERAGGRCASSLLWGKSRSTVCKMHGEMGPRIVTRRNAWFGGQ